MPGECDRKGKRSKSLRRIILGILTIIVVLLSVGPALISSLTEPQIANRLELYQADLLLQARELDPPEGFDVQDLSNALGGASSLEEVTKQFEETRQSVQENLTQIATQLQDNRQGLSADDSQNLSPSSPVPTPPISGNPVSGSPVPESPVSESGSTSPALVKNIKEQQTLSNDLGLRLGILYAVQEQPSEAIAIWSPIAERELTVLTTSTALSTEISNQVDTAQILIGLWSDSSQILPDAEPQLRQTLTGWFRTRALERLYQLQQRSDALEKLLAEEQVQAQATLVKLGLLGLGPALGCLGGVVLLVVLISQRIIKGKEALLADNGNLGWTTPWPWEITWQVLIVGFFFLGQIILPILVGLLRGIVAQVWLNQGIPLTLSSGRVTAVTTAIVYLLMAIASILVLYFSIKPYLPLPEGWFQASIKGRWFLWGLGGYFCAVPLVIGVSLINQQIWQGRGGSNPLLEIVLNEGDRVALGIFFFTAAIAAPIFEEILFRGFLLPSLTRYMPVWGAIALSSLIFATAHLSFSEVLPLTILGLVLGFVYTRSRNLLASMMVHSLWNSATMIGLLVLGSSID